MADRVKILLQAKDQTKAAFKSVNKSMKKLDKASAALGVSLGPIAAFASAGAIVAIGSQAIKAADEIQKMSQRLSISTEALSQYRHVAELSGTNFEVLAKGVAKSQRAIADADDGLSTAVRAIEDMNLSLTDLKQLSPEDAFEAMGAAVAAIEDPYTRASAAANVFGRAGKELLPIFNDGAASVRAMREEADRLGLTLTQEMADKAAAAADAGARLDSIWKGVAQTLTVAVAPALTTVGTMLSDAFTGSAKDARNELMALSREFPEFHEQLRQASIEAGGFSDAMFMAEIAAFKLSRVTRVLDEGLNFAAGAEQFGALREAPVIMKDYTAATLTGTEAIDDFNESQDLMLGHMSEMVDIYDRVQAEIDGMNTGLGESTAALDAVGEQASESSELMQSAGEQAASGFSDAIIDAALRSEDALESLGNVARSVFNMIISGFLRMGISALINPVGALASGVGSQIGPDIGGGLGGFDKAGGSSGSTVIINGGMNVTANSTLNTDPMSIRRLATQLKSELTEVGRHQG